MKKILLLLLLFPCVSFAQTVTVDSVLSSDSVRVGRIRINTNTFLLRDSLVSVGGLNLGSHRGIFTSESGMKFQFNTLDTAFFPAAVSNVLSWQPTSDGDTLKIQLGTSLNAIDLEVNNSTVFSVDTVGNITATNISGTNTGDEALSTSSAGLTVSDHAVDLNGAQLFVADADTVKFQLGISDTVFAIEINNQTKLWADSTGKLTILDDFEAGGNVTATGNVSGSNLIGTNTGDQTITTASAGIDITGADQVDLDVTPSSGSATLIQEEDALQVKYTSPLTEGASGLALNQNAGTDITADLEEEAHASEHQDGGADEINLQGLDAISDGDTLKIRLNTDLYGIDYEVNNTRVFAVDTLGNVTANNGVDFTMSSGQVLYADDANSVLGDARLTYNSVGNTVKVGPGFISHSDPLRLHVSDTTGNGTSRQGILVEAHHGIPSYAGVRSQDSIYNPRAVGSGNVLVELAGWGYDGTDYGTNAYARIQLSALETWTNTEHGSAVRFQITPLDSDAVREAYIFKNDVIQVQGLTEDAFYTNLLFGNPTSSINLTFPSSGGDGALMTSSLTTNVVNGANSIWGGSNSLRFEGATADDFEAIVQPTDPTHDNTITLPDTTGTVVVYQGTAAANNILQYNSAGVGSWERKALNAGTDLTADLEEETHASEHQDGGADEIAVTAGMMNAGSGAAATTLWHGNNTWGQVGDSDIAAGAIDGGAGGEIEDNTITAADIDETDNYTWTGAHDLGGAVSLEIPNGAGGTTVNVAGEITLDTTPFLGSLNYYDTAERSISPLITKSIIIIDPVANDSLIAFGPLPFATTIDSVRAVLDGAGGVDTDTVNVVVRHSTDYSVTGPNGSGNALFSGAQSVDNFTTGERFATFNDATVPADSWISANVTTKGGTVTRLVLTFYMHKDP